MNPGQASAGLAAGGPGNDDSRPYNRRMNSAGGIPSGLRPPMLWRAARAALLAAGAAQSLAVAVAVSGLAAAPTAGLAAASTASAGPASPVPIPVLALALWGLPLLVGGAGLGLMLGRQRQRSAAELREVRERLRCIDELLDVWQWQTDAEHRLVLLSPPRSAPAADWLAARPGTLLWQHFDSADEAALRAQLASQALLDDVDVQDRSAAGGPRRFSLRGRPRSDAAGQFAGYQGLLREVLPAPSGAEGAGSSATPAAALIAKPRDNGAAAPDAGTLEADHESFNFSVSHDLRAPIRVVEGFTKIVKEDYGRLLDRVGNDHLDRVLGAAARMNNMIDALLALSKLSSQPLARQPVNLSQLAAYVADDLRRQWPEREVQIDIEAGLLVQGDPTLLRVVIENLLGNAWKYSAKAAQPKIALRRRVSDADTFTVCDNGAGFDMRFADRLFGVFQRLHSASDFPGTGVGLASVRRIVRRHGGEIWGEAEVNRGASFHFSLPQVQRV